MYLTAERPFDGRWGFRVNYTLGERRGDRRRSVQPRLPPRRRLSAPSVVDRRAPPHRRSPASSALPGDCHRSARSRRWRPGSATRSATTRSAPASTSAAFCSSPAGRRTRSTSRTSTSASRRSSGFGAAAGVGRVRGVQHLQLDELRLLQRRHSAAAEHEPELRHAVVHGRQQPAPAAVRRPLRVLATDDTAVTQKPDTLA